MPMLLRAVVFVAVSVLLAAVPARAEEPYPNKPVRIIVPFAPAGPADIVARLMAQKLSEEFGKQFYVENHAGAGGNIGAGVAARAPADGLHATALPWLRVIRASAPALPAPAAPAMASAAAGDDWETF